MENKYFVICDSEQEYAIRLAALLSKRIGYQVYRCSSVEEVQKLAGKKKIEVLLIEDVLCRELDSVRAEQLIILAGRDDPENQDNCIYKYQSSGAILEAVIAICAKGEQTGILKQQIYRDCGLIGIYSPVGRTGKTAFALALGMEAAKRERVLYLNLETYSGWEDRTGKKEPYTLADLLYYARQEKGNIEARLEIMSGTMEELEYIAPMAVSEDLKAVSAKEWEEFLELLQSRKIYKKIIIDFGDCVQGLWQMLGLCREIYMPVREDVESAAKIRQFERNAELLGHGELMERVVKLAPGNDVMRDVRRIMKRKEWRYDRGRTASRKNSAGN